MIREKELFEKVCLMVEKEEYDKCFQEWYHLAEQKDDNEKRKVIEQLKALLGKKTYIDVFLYSVMLYLLHSAKTMKEFFNYIDNNSELTWQNLFYLAQQLGVLIFQYQEYDKYEFISSNWKLLKRAYEMCRSELGMELRRIPMEERNEGLGLVIAEQILSDHHGPTKTALDRCLAIKKNLGEVLLLNTAEELSPVGRMQWEFGWTPNYLEILNEWNYYEWRGVKIPFVQCDNCMPDLRTMRLLLENIKQLKPKVVIAVGGMSIFAGLVNEIIPVLNVSTTQSGLSTVMTDFQTAFLRENDTINISNANHLLEEVGINRNHIIEGKFTFAFKEQFSTVTREELGIKTNEIILAVIGYRLDDELDERFWKMIEESITDNIRLIILGKYNEENLGDISSDLRQHVIYAGICEDVLAYLDICDLYINPIRKGGGTSAVEALYKGIPVVSLDYGDVAGIVGKNFICENYEEVKNVIHKYVNDKDFYNKQSQIARCQARELMDTDGEFWRIIKEYIEAQEGSFY